MNKLIKLLALGTVLPLSLNSLNLVSVSYSSDNSLSAGAKVDKQAKEIENTARRYCNSLNANLENLYKTGGTMGCLYNGGNLTEASKLAAELLQGGNTSAEGSFNTGDKATVAILIDVVSKGLRWDFSNGVDDMIDSLTVYAENNGGEEKLTSQKDYDKYCVGKAYLSAAVVQEMLIKLRDTGSAILNEWEYDECCDNVIKYLRDNSGEKLEYKDEKGKEIDLKQKVKSMTYGAICRTMGEFYAPLAPFPKSIKKRVAYKKYFRTCAVLGLENYQKTEVSKMIKIDFNRIKQLTNDEVLVYEQIDEICNQIKFLESNETRKKINEILQYTIRKVKTVVNKSRNVDDRKLEKEKKVICGVKKLLTDAEKDLIEQYSNCNGVTFLDPKEFVSANSYDAGVVTYEECWNRIQQKKQKKCESLNCEKGPLNRMPFTAYEKKNQLLWKLNALTDYQNSGYLLSAILLNRFASLPMNDSELISKLTNYLGSKDLYQKLQEIGLEYISNYGLDKNDKKATYNYVDLDGNVFGGNLMIDPDKTKGEKGPLLVKLSDINRKLDAGYADEKTYDVSAIRSDLKREFKNWVNAHENDSNFNNEYTKKVRQLEPIYRTLTSVDVLYRKMGNGEFNFGTEINWGLKKNKENMESFENAKTCIKNWAYLFGIQQVVSSESKHQTLSENEYKWLKKIGKSVELEWIPLLSACKDSKYHLNLTSLINTLRQQNYNIESSFITKNERPDAKKSEKDVKVRVYLDGYEYFVSEVDLRNPVTAAYLNLLGYDIKW